MAPTPLLRLFAVPCVVFGLGACQTVQSSRALSPNPPPRNLDVPYVPTSREVVDRMLRMADAKPGDILYDLGSGDGRIVIAAVRNFGVARGVGVDLNPVRVAEATANAAAAGVSEKVSFVEGNVFDFNFSEATIVTMYLLEHVNRKLRPRVLALKPGTRVVSHQFTMGDWEPDEWVREYNADIMFWTVPAQVGGSWQWGAYRLDLSQKYQNVSGTLQAGGRRTNIDRVRLKGDHLRFRARFMDRAVMVEGRIVGDRIEATVNGEQAVIRRVI